MLGSKMQQVEPVEEEFRSENVAHCQAATLGSASAITFVCAAPSDRAVSIVQVEALVLAKDLILLGTLDGWLAPSFHTQIVKFGLCTIGTGKGKPFMCDPSVKKFLEDHAGPAVTAALVDKRPRIDLVGPSGVSPKKAGHWAARLVGGSDRQRCCRRQQTRRHFRTSGGGSRRDILHPALQPLQRQQLAGQRGVSEAAAACPPPQRPTERELLPYLTPLRRNLHRRVAESRDTAADTAAALPLAPDHTPAVKPLLWLWQRWAAAPLGAAVDAATHRGLRISSGGDTRSGGSPSLNSRPESASMRSFPSLFNLCRFDGESRWKLSLDFVTRLPLVSQLPRLLFGIAAFKFQRRQWTLYQLPNDLCQQRCQVCLAGKLEIKFRFCDEVSFGFSGSKAFWFSAASNISDGRFISYSITWVSNAFCFSCPLAISSQESAVLAGI